jgi:hypothetical protein
MIRLQWANLATCTIHMPLLFNAEEAYADERALWLF